MMLTSGLLACAELQTEPLTDAATSVDDEDSGYTAPVEAKIITGVGSVAPELSSCVAAGTKAKARYGCVFGWKTLGANYFRNLSGTCSQGKDYLIFSTTNQPIANSTVFEVDWKIHSNSPDGWQLRQYITCSCDNAPCRVTNSNGQ